MFECKHAKKIFEDKESQTQHTMTKNVRVVNNFVPRLPVFKAKGNTGGPNSLYEGRV